MWNYFIIPLYQSTSSTFSFSSIKEPKFLSFNQLFPHKGPGDLSIDKKVVKNFDEYCKLFTFKEINVLEKLAQIILFS